MSKKTDCIETNYNRHIVKARTYVKGFSGYERALKVCEYFEKAGHPHPEYTFKVIRFSGDGTNSDRQFSIELMKDMAYLVAENEMLASIQQQTKQQ